MSARTKPRKPRTLKTAKQRAEEALALAQRAHDRAKENLDAANATQQAAQERFNAAAKRLVHKQNDPDLLDDPQLPLGGAE